MQRLVRRMLEAPFAMAASKASLFTFRDCRLSMFWRVTGSSSAQGRGSLPPPAAPTAAARAAIASADSAAVAPLCPYVKPVRPWSTAAPALSSAGLDRLSVDREEGGAGAAAGAPPRADGMRESEGAGALARADAVARADAPPPTGARLVDDSDKPGCAAVEAAALEVEGLEAEGMAAGGWFEGSADGGVRPDEAAAALCAALCAEPCRGGGGRRERTGLDGHAVGGGYARGERSW